MINWLHNQLTSNQQEINTDKQKSKLLIRILLRIVNDPSGIAEKKISKDL